MNTDPALLRRVLRLLMQNGQTTERTVAALHALGRRAGVPVEVVPGWECSWLSIAGAWEVVQAPATGIEMHKVAATMRLAEAGLDAPRLDAIEAMAPVGTPRFAALAAAGAMALAVVFGAAQLTVVLAVGVVAGLGALLRRVLARRSHNLFVQPCAAALLAGLAGAAAWRLLPGAAASLVALCPCMILVPGPHLLNGALDVLRGRLPLGLHRLAYAGVTLLVVCTGLLAGFSLSGATLLPQAGPTATVPFLPDVAAAGVAVLAYGTFFSMSWRTLPASVLTGMAAHALRWVLLAQGSSVWVSALAACLLVGVVMSPFADRTHLPYAGCAFAAVVSLIPGVFVFRMASGVLAALQTPSHAAWGEAAAQGGTAAITFLAMAAGLLIPRLALERRREKAA